MAAARLNLPAVVVTGGYMQLNRFKGERIDPLDVAPKHYQEFRQGKLAQADYEQIRNAGCAGIGSCPVMGTANTMAAMAEALGMSLTGNATLPGADSRLQRLALMAGRKIMTLLESGIRPSDVMPMGAFDNAIRVLMATGGSTNAVLHLQAIAAELDLDIEPESFNRISRSTPFICDVSPSGPGGNLLQDLDEAGGIAAVMKELLPILNRDVITVTGRTMGKNLEDVVKRDAHVIRSMAEPLDKAGGLVFLSGNLAPNGALIKRSAVPEAMLLHTGPACIFSDEESACEALIADQIESGSVVVVRYVGPKGDPGMRLLQRFLWLLAAKGMQDKIAFITDGRFSGTNKGCAVGHIGPEAAEGGPLAVIADGDRIEINIQKERIQLLVDEVELEKRLHSWSPPEIKVRRGYLSIYSRLAKSADRGAALNYR